MVYGTNLHLPGKFFTPCKDQTVDPTSYVHELKNTMQTLRAIPMLQPSHPCLHINTAPSSASHVFVRHDAVKTSPYDGPYKVLKRDSKYFTLDIKDHQDTVSVDRLKPAHLDRLAFNNATNPPVSPPPQPPNSRTAHPCVQPCHYSSGSSSTRSGRRVH